MGKIAGALYGAGLTKMGDIVKRAGQIATDPFGINPKGKTVVDDAGNMYTTMKGKADTSGFLPTVSGAQTESKSPVLPSITDSNIYKNATASRTDQAKRDAIGRDWNDSEDVIKSASGAVKGLKGTIGDLSKARDAYLRANDENLNAKKAAIEGNRQLITRNQTNDLRDLAEGVRKGIFNTNISLGAGAGSSASLAAAKAIQGAAAKNRAETLTGYGDQISTQNQNETNANDSYALQRDQAYKWEENERAKAIETYSQAKKVLDRLKSKVPDWKKQDIDNESNAKLNELLSSLTGIAAQARGYRDTLASLYSGMTGSADALRGESIGIDAPAELNTPEFNAELDTTGLDGEDQYADSYYNPNVKFKKRVGADIFNNPLVFGEE